MRLFPKLMVALAALLLALGPIACTGSSWCADCSQATTILGLNYQPANTYTMGSPIPVNPPNPSGGTPRAYEVTAGALPAGLSLDPATGQITGTPTAAGVFTLTISGSNAANSASQTIQITVLPALPLALAYATPQVFPAATAIALQSPVLAQATPGIPTTFALTSGSLPAGLALNADGTIAGTPTTPGASTFSVTATNGTRTAVASASYTVLVVGSLGLNYVTPRTFSAGLAVATQSCALVNATPGMPTTYAITTGSLPAGLVLSAATGDITGTPATPGVYPFTVTATNGTRTATSSPTFTVTPAAALSLVYDTPKSFAAGATIATQSATLGNATPGVATTYALTGGALPAGLSLDPAAGTITGTPTTPGLFAFTVAATNGTRSATASATYTVVPAGALTLDYTSPQTFTSGSAIATQAPTVTNATPGVTITYAVTSGSLPAGLTLNADGTITGTPTTPGVSTFTITATNGTRTATSSPTYTVNPPAPQGSYLSVVTTVIVPLTLTPQNLGGAITTATLNSGPLPSGMTLNADGTITGTPTTTGVFPFTVQLCDGANCMVTAMATITVNGTSVTPMGAAYGTGSGVVGTPLSALPSVTTGGPVTAAILQNGSLPPGMTLNANGSITGTPTAAGTFTALVTLANASGGDVTVAETIIVSSTGSTPLVVTYPVGESQVGTAVTVAPAIPSGGPATGAVLAGGVLPPGMTLNPNGTITGTPSQAGSFLAQVQLCNATGGCTVQSVRIDVNTAGTPLVATYTNATAPAGNPLVVAPAITSGGPVTGATLLSGSVPPGLTLNADGTITGTPTQVGTYTLNLRLCNGAGGCTTQPVTITIIPGALSVSYLDRTFPLGAVIATQGATVTNATTGIATTFAVTSGSLPPGLLLNAATGDITGTPTNAQAATPFTVTATNGTRTAQKVVTYTVTSTAPVASYTPAVTPLGTPVSATPTNAGGIITSASITAGGVAGITVASNGVIAANGSVPMGNYPLTLSVCNGTNCQTVNATITVTPVAALTLNYTTPASFPLGAAIVTQSATVTNTTTGIATTFAVTSGSLPAGLLLNAATGDITGTTTTAQAATPFTITATNGTRTAQKVVTYTVTSTAPVASYTPAVTPLGTPISATPTNSGGIITSASITAGGVAGITVAPSGIITAAGSVPMGNYPLTLSVCNGTNCQTVNATITVTPVAALTLNYTTPASFPLGAVIATQSATVTNTTTGIATTFAVTSGSLPAGLLLNAATGDITGTPTSAQAATAFTVTATNGTRTAQKVVTYTVTSTAPVASYTPAVTPLGTPVSATPTNSGGIITSASITAGGVAGITVASNGVITAAASVPVGNYPLTLSVCNGTNCQTVNATITVTPVAALTLNYTTPATFPLGAVIATQSATVTNTTTGIATTFAVTSGSLPAGLLLNAATGDITGTPTTAQAATPFTVTATNGTRTAQKVVTYTVTSTAPVASYTPAVTPLGTPVSATPTNSGGIITSASITAGGVAGITVASNGVITASGTVPMGNYPLTLSVCNGTNCQTVSATITVTPVAALTLNYTTPATFPLGAVIATQSATVTNTTTGIATTFAVTSGSLPPGLLLNAATGDITGTPTTAQAATPFTVTATNGTRTAQKVVTYTVTSTAPVASYTPAVTPLGTPVSATPTNSGGIITSASITSGGVAGITVASNGVITASGTVPMGNYPLTLSVCNGTNCQTVSTTITVNPVSNLTVAYATPQTYTVGTAIATQSPTLTNSNPGLATTYVISSGALPTGLALNASTGAITGTPTVGNVYTFTVSASNGTRTPAVSNTVTDTVVGAPTASLAASTLIAYTGTAATLTPTFTIPGGGGFAVIDQSINGGSAVASGTGYSTGIRNTESSTTYTLTVTNALGATATASVTVKWVSLSAIVNVVNVPGGSVYTTTSDPDSPLYNVKIVVPDQSVYDGGGSTLCNGNTALTITWETSLTVGTPLATGAYDYSHSFNFQTDVTHPYPFRVPVTVTLPYKPTLSTPNLGNGDLPVPFYWDPTFSKWEAAGLKSVDTVNHTVTFTTLLPGRYAVLGIPGLGIASTSTLSSPTFVNGTDDWYQWNQGVFNFPGGSSLGMSSFASWYDLFWKGNAGNTTKPGVGLHSVFPTNSDVNAQALISRLANGTLEDWNQMWKQQYATDTGGSVGAVNYGLTDAQTGLALITGLKVTNQPQIFLMADARPASGNAVATAVYGYDGTAHAFSLVDPNYPGDATTALTINWDPTANSGAGAFSSYNRSAGYTPTLDTYAYEGQTSIHRLQDYEIVFDGATRTAPWQDPPFASIAMATIGNSSQVGNLTLTQTVSSATNVLIAGTVTNPASGGDTPPHDYVFLSVDGNVRTATQINLSTGAFSFTVPSLPNQYGTTMMLETSQSPCDPTFAHSGFQTFKVASLPPWFKDACFEAVTMNGTYGSNQPSGQPNPLTQSAVGSWTHQYVTTAATSLNGYPVDGNGNFLGSFDANGDILGYCNVSGSAPSWTITLVPGTSYVGWTSGFLPNAGGFPVGSQLLTNGGSNPIDPHAHTTAGNAATTYLSEVLSGSNAFRLNDDWNQGNQSQGLPFYSHSTSTVFRSQERLTQVITVPSTINSPQISFWWAAVLQAGTTAHATPQRPFIDVIIQDMGTGTTPTWSNTGDSNNYGNIYYHHFYAGDPAFAGWRPSVASATDTEWVSIPWQKMNLNLSAYKGHKVRVVIAVSDCTGGAHAGYAYVDSLTCD